MAPLVSSITATQIASLRTQLGISQQDLADRLHAIDPLLTPNRHTVSRWEREGGPVPNAYAQAAIARLWLHEGYPCTTDGQDATLTTNSSASSWGQPAVLIDGVPHGSAEIGPLDLGDAPAMIVEAVRRAGYGVVG